MVEVAVGDVGFVGLRVDEDLGDAAEVVHVVAVGDGLAVHHARALLAELRHELAVARELQDVRVGTAVAADPHDALVIDDDAVVRVGPVGMQRRTAPAVHDVAGRIEGDHRRRRVAALADAVGPGVYSRRRWRSAGGRSRGPGAPPRTGASAGGCAYSVLSRLAGVVAAMNDPDLVLLVDAETDRLPEHPVVRHRLGPERIDFEHRRLRAGSWPAPAPSVRGRSVTPRRSKRRRRSRQSGDSASRLHPFDRGPPRLNPRVRGPQMRADSGARATRRSIAPEIRTGASDYPCRVVRRVSRCIAWNAPTSSCCVAVSGRRPRRGQPVRTKFRTKSRSRPS